MDLRGQLPPDPFKECYGLNPNRSSIGLVQQMNLQLLAKHCDLFNRKMEGTPHETDFLAQALASAHF
jgi:hypothetical protein